MMPYVYMCTQANDRVLAKLQASTLRAESPVNPEGERPRISYGGKERR